MLRETKSAQRIERIRVEITPDLQKLFLPHNNGIFIVCATILDNKGMATTQTERIGSCATRKAAKLCCNAINAQNPDFQAFVETDSRKNTTEDAYPLRTDWEGATAIQQGPFYVFSNFLDEHGRHLGAGVVAYFINRSSAVVCATQLNNTNPAYQAGVEKNEDFRQSAAPTS